MKVTRFQPGGLDSVAGGLFSSGVSSVASNAYAINGLVVTGTADGSNYHLVSYSSNYARWIPHDASVGGSGDVATDTIWNAKGDLAVGTGSDTAQRLAVGANDTIPMADSTATTGIKWVASATPTDQDYDDVADAGTSDTFARGDHLHGMPSAGGGGSFTHSYVGYNTIGGSLETAAVNAGIHAKQITLASDGFLASIGAYAQISAAGSVSMLGVAVYDDNSGAPGRVIAMGQAKMGQINMNANDPRWLHSPVGVWLTAGTYWIAIRDTDTGGSNLMRISYDGSGSDRTATGTSEQWPDWARITPTTTSNRYSIRASVLT